MQLSEAEKVVINLMSLAAVTKADARANSVSPGVTTNVIEVDIAEEPTHSSSTISQPNSDQPKQYQAAKGKNLRKEPSQFNSEQQPSVRTFRKIKKNVHSDYE